MPGFGAQHVFVRGSRITCGGARKRLTDVLSAILWGGASSRRTLLGKRFRCPPSGPCGGHASRGVSAEWRHPLVGANPLSPRVTGTVFVDVGGHAPGTPRISQR